MKQVRAWGLAAWPSGVGTIRRFRRTVLSAWPGSFRVIANEQSRSALRVSTSIGSSEILPSPPRVVLRLEGDRLELAAGVPRLDLDLAALGREAVEAEADLTFCLIGVGSPALVVGPGPGQRRGDRQSGHP